MIVGTLFKSIFDNKTDKGINLPDFNHFEKVLYKLSEKNRKHKKDAELMSPAIYKPGTTRSNDNVTSWGGWCAVDVDIEVNEEPWNKYYHIKYSTASSTKTLPKFRLVFHIRWHRIQQYDFSFGY